MLQVVVFMMMIIIIIIPKFHKPILSAIRRKKMKIIFSLQNMFRIKLYSSSVPVMLNFCNITH